MLADKSTTYNQEIDSFSYDGKELLKVDNETQKVQSLQADVELFRINTSSAAADYFSKGLFYVPETLKVAIEKEIFPDEATKQKIEGCDISELKNITFQFKSMDQGTSAVFELTP